jgi:hypothetical protein
MTAFCGIPTAYQERKKECPDWAYWRRKQSGANLSLAFPVRLGKYREQEQAMGDERCAIVALCQASGGNS